ncbi:hypothetical protein RHMOL_Rhmol03G0287600 [Rhododendron molle]|uniref:Uncharacterized protein n=1 Tax=Rhododendron molle TaxID=49168 RepID=A0ACC0PL65_RHOML|nr:hypothetical protein RHMOL_Rhmol03G0287600 [Rhododendron molle]
MAHGNSRGSRGTNIDPTPPSEDIGWKFGDMVENNNRSKVKCKFCGKIMSGGTTRLKEHLAHKKGQVASCDQVTSQVRVLMMEHLQGTTNKQFDKRKRKEELKEQIRATQCDEKDEYDAFNMHNDDSDPEMTTARQESLRLQNEYEERERFKHQMGDRYHVGESSGAGGGRVELGPPPGFGKVDLGPPPGFNRRNSSLRETGTTNKWTNLSSPAARLAEIEVDLDRSKGKKQAKLSSRLLQTARKKLGRAVSQFVIYTRLPINTVNSPWLEPMLDVAREVGKGTKLPRTYEVSEVYLPQEMESLKKWVQCLKPSWKERGVSVMCDGWSGPRRNHIVNFLVYSNHGTIYHKSIDATHVLSRTADYYFGLMDKAVEEIGEEYMLFKLMHSKRVESYMGKKSYLFGSSEDVRWWSSSGVKIWRSQWREPSVKSRGWEKKSPDHATVKDRSAAAKEIEVIELNQRPKRRPQPKFLILLPKNGYSNGQQNRSPQWA